MDAMAISRTALDVEWQRLQVIADNLANLNSTRSADGGVFRPRRLVSGPATDFASLMAGSASPDQLSGVRVQGLEVLPGGVRKVYQPGHPHADVDGFVSLPNVNRGEEMTLMIQASRAYEANLAAFNMAQQMYSRALDLGRQS